MKIDTSLLMVTSLILSFSAYANTDVKSKLFIQQDDLNTIGEIADNNKIDFFELAKKNKKQLPEPTLDWDSSPIWNSSATENMNENERSQYLFNQRNYAGLNSQLSLQKIDALKKSRDDGKISNKQYQREVQILKMYTQPKRPGSVGFSIPYN